MTSRVTLLFTQSNKNGFKRVFKSFLAEEDLFNLGNRKMLFLSNSLLVQYIRHWWGNTTVIACTDL